MPIVASFYFIEVNPRIQVEHTVTEEVHWHRLGASPDTGRDGYRLGDTEAGLPPKLK